MLTVSQDCAGVVSRYSKKTRIAYLFSVENACRCDVSRTPVTVIGCGKFCHFLKRLPLLHSSSSRRIKCKSMGSKLLLLID